MAENKAFDRRWFMYDLARQRTFVRDEFILWLDAFQRLGFNGLGLYLEGAFDFDSIPGVIRENIMTPEDARWAVEEGKKRGINVFPMTNVVGHMNHFFDQERNRPLMSEFSCDQMNFLSPEAEAYAMNLVHEYARHFGSNLVHIGGDETTLTPETKMEYARFLAKICDNMLAEGLRPAIWNDMIWMEPELCEPFSRKVMIFDWNYYGHRPESIAFFREQGFEDVLACPCDNSWEGVINRQRLCPHLKARTDWPVQPDEIEAFLDDAAQQQSYNACITHWDNTAGRNVWPQWAAFARAALYMNGRIERGEQADEAIEMALFGRITPYTEVTHLIQNDIQRSDLSHKWFMAMRDSLFLINGLNTLIRRAADEAPAFPEDIDRVLPVIEEKLASWTPASAFEEHCLAGMNGTAAIIRASNAITKAGRGYQTCYRRAADLQFTSKTTSAQLLNRLAGLFRTAAAEVLAARLIFEGTLSGTGHTRNDLKLMEANAGKLQRIAGLIEGHTAALDRIPLPRFERIIDCALKEAPLLS